MGCVRKLLLLLVGGTNTLGGFIKVSAMFVKSVTNCLNRRVILISTSRVSTRVRNRTAVLIVVKTLHGKLTSCYTYGVYIVVRSPTSVLCVTKVSV